MLFYCWSTVFDAGPTLKQHRVNDPCFLGYVSDSPVTLSLFALRSAELEQSEEKRIKNGMDVVHTEYNRIRTGWWSRTSNMFEILSRFTGLGKDWVRLYFERDCRTGNGIALL